MATPTKKRATYQDVLDAPPEKVAELINGELHLFPRPAGPHTRVASVLGVKLGGSFDVGDNGPGGWLILDEPELHHDSDIVVPDIAGWRRERMAVVPDGYFTLAPDWVCEVLSPSTERFDRRDKLPFYAAFGVPSLWFINPRARTLEVFALRDGQWMLVGVHGADDRVRAVPFTELELDLARLWAELPLPTRAGEESAYGSAAW